MLAITDEIYEHIIYDGHRHVPIATLDGMAERTVTINGLSKTFSVTGWRVGWAIAPDDLAGPIRKMHDFLTVGAPAPLQEAGVTALAMPESYYAEMAAGYARRRKMMCDILERHGFKFKPPQGAYYVMTDIAHFGFDYDIEFARYLVTEVGVAVVPGSSFFNDRKAGRTKVRFVYSKKDETLREADKRLAKLAARVHAALVADDAAEVDPLHLEVALVLVDDVADVQASIADLRAHVVVEVHRAVEIEVEVVGPVLLADALGNLEADQLAGDGDVRHDVHARDAADVRNRRLRVDEVAADRRSAGRPGRRWPSPASRTRQTSDRDTGSRTRSRAATSSTTSRS